MKRLKFLHLSTGDNRGAFSGAYRLHRNLIDSGHSSMMFVGNKETNDDNVITVTAFEQKIRLFLQKLSGLLARLVLGSDLQSTRIFKANLPFVSISKYLKLFKSFDPDFIIVYYVADFLSEKQILKIKESTSAEVVFYLMDMGMLTGSCHYAWECSGFKGDCSNCPATQSSFFKRMIGKKWKLRDYNYKQIDPIVVSGSEQLSQQVAASSLLKTMRLKKILIGIDEKIYHQHERELDRSNFGFSKGEIVIYFGAQNVMDARKGFVYLLEALNILSAKLPAEQCDAIRIFTVGSGKPLGGEELKFRHTHLSYISNQTFFAKTYSASDLFICPSIEDSGPMMINESIISGTPVVAFDLGVAKDLVIDGKTGFLASAINGVELAKAIEKYLQLNYSEQLLMREDCLYLGLKDCSISKQVGDFINLSQR